jgi:hypothetical protein
MLYLINKLITILFWYTQQHAREDIYNHDKKNNNF